MVALERSDVAHETSLLSIFSEYPREGHLKRVLRVFRYLKKRPNRRFVIDSRELELRGGKDALDKYFA